MRAVRIRFKKIENAKYISHLDLTRTMARAVRRAGIPLWYTEGFNRHPYITFASPLSLGFESLCESMDIRLVEDMPMDELVRRLNSVLPAGLEVIKAGEPVMKPKEIAFAAYRIAFQNSGFADFKENIREFLSRQSIEALKKTKKGDLKNVDLKPALKNAAVRVDDRSVVIEVVLPCGGKDTISPNLLCSAINDFLNEKSGIERKLFCGIMRVNLLNGEGVPFE